MLKCEKHVLESMKYNISRGEMNLFYIDFVCTIHKESIKYIQKHIYF